MTIDERLKALETKHRLVMARIQNFPAENTKDIAALQDVAKQDGVEIRELLRIAESRNRA
jgi:hypothetical protein